MYTCLLYMLIVFRLRGAISLSLERAWTNAKVRAKKAGGRCSVRIQVFAGSLTRTFPLLFRKLKMSRRLSCLCFARNFGL